MSGTELTAAADFLRDAAKKYFEEVYQKPPIASNAVVDPDLKWVPTLNFRINDHLTVIGEVSETPYPMVFHLRRVDLEDSPIPIAVYCICPEEAYVQDQAAAKELMGHGYGLLTVAADGTVQKRAGCIPIIQLISDKHFKDEIKLLPKKIRQRLAEAFERYKHNPPSGVVDITEVLEGLILKAANEAAARKWIEKKDTKALAAALDAMYKSKQLSAHAAAIGSAQGYISIYRNASHHFPKNKKQAAKKYKDCRHAFLDGLKRIDHFRHAMKKATLTGNL